MKLNAVIKSKSIYFLYLLPFIVAIIVFVHEWVGGKYTPCSNDGIISFPFLTLSQESLWMKEVGILLLLFLSFFLFFVSDRCKFLSSPTALPALFYSLLTVGVYCRYGLNTYLVAAFCTALAVWRLQVAIIYTKTNAPVFDFGFFVSLSVLLCPDLIMLLLWSILVIPFSGRATLKDLVALFMGLLTPVLFTVGYYFWVDQLTELPELFVDILLSGESFVSLIMQNPIPFAVFMLLILVSLINVLMHYPTSIVAQRRGILALLSMLLFIGSSLFFLPFSCHGVMYVLAIPLAYLFSQYFISHRTKWMGSVLFLILLVACVLFVFY